MKSHINTKIHIFRELKYTVQKIKFRDLNGLLKYDLLIRFRIKPSKLKKRLSMVFKLSLLLSMYFLMSVELKSLFLRLLLTHE